MPRRTKKKIASLSIPFKCFESLTKLFFFYMDQGALHKEKVTMESWCGVSLLFVRSQYNALPGDSVQGMAWKKTEKKVTHSKDLNF